VTPAGQIRLGSLVLMRILIIAAVILFLILWVRALIDVFRRGDLSVAAKAAWAIVMLLIPFIGLLLYYMLRPSDAQIVQRS
jgi:Phospholipase_D-nuclease N-terminal